jgi:hypothetical protein
MRFIIKLLFVFELFALSVSQQASKNVSIDRKLPLLSMIRSFGIGQTSTVKAEATRFIFQLYKTKLAIEKKIQELKEAELRKLTNERLMPLMHGNSFMKDFYSGRF